ncbi:hypothetical protein FAES_1063 [Fibrella aestuarina BUZ 2]|uniref:Uncharacterized protein n=1 Tax=Fibrella aestuarina BUZ 2 TaxID=1166018 RepID=I0K4M0_9BACT|nr:hypothetical protein FAES_1063 [Fibrella aestuarina BUZ 2]
MAAFFGTGFDKRVLTALLRCSEGKIILYFVFIE